MADVEDLRAERIDVTYRKLYDRLPHKNQGKSKYSFQRKRYEKYAILHENDKKFTINSFEQIGWLDPYRDEKTEGNFEKPTSIYDHIYGSDRMKEGFVPYVIYLPKKTIMFKIMRACIDIKDEKELWFLKKE